jgi:hypothetical protein
MAIGFSLNVTIMLLLMALSITSMGWVFHAELAGRIELTALLFPSPRQG